MAYPETTRENLVVHREWSEIPWFRKPFFLIVLFLLFMPGYLVMIWTGDTYHRKNGVVYRTSLKVKKTMTIVVVLVMLTYLIQSFK